MDNDFLLSTPLLCRYAYQIVCALVDTDFTMDAKDESSNLLSSQIEIALRSYIKWEFHDEYNGPTESGRGKERLNSYIDNAFRFFSELAFYMRETGIVRREVWVQKQSASKISINAALCVLQENEDGELFFVHKSFCDYFLSRYFVEQHIMGESSKELIEALAAQIKYNLSFCNLFAEVMLSMGGELSDKICKTIKEKHDKQATDDSPIMLIAKHLTGEMHFLYHGKLPFTIEDYFYIFPNGIVEFAGNKFDRAGLEELRCTRILKTYTPDLLSSCHAESIFSTLKLRGVMVLPHYHYDFKVIISDFDVYDNRKFENAGEFYRLSFTEQNMLQIIRKVTIEEMIEEYSLVEDEKVDSQKVIASLITSDIICRKKMLDKIMEEEKEKINEINNHIINFLGIEKRYWCLFEEGTFFICESSQDNAHYFAEYYEKEALQSLFDRIILYGQYRSLIKEENEIIDKLKFQKNTEIEMLFHHEAKGLFVTNILKCYYGAHWRNANLFQFSASELLKANIENLIKIEELFETYRIVEIILREKPNDLISLIISDERLITYYLFGWGESMIKLANETMELCRKYDHPQGEEFRRFLIADETSFVGEDRKKVEDYSKNYIWF